MNDAPSDNDQDFRASGCAVKDNFYPFILPFLWSCDFADGVVVKTCVTFRGKRKLQLPACKNKKALKIKGNAAALICIHQRFIVLPRLRNF